MADPLILDPEQEADAQKMASSETGSSLDASTMSAGKTVVALRVAAIRGARQILIAAPLQTRLGWEQTAKNGWIPPSGEFESLADLPFYWIRNHKDGRHAINMLQFGEPGIYFIGLQYAVTLAWDVAGYKLLWNQDETPKIDPKTGLQKKKVVKKRNTFWDGAAPDMLIVDEVHKGGANARTQTHKTWEQMKPGFKHFQSGTPHGNFFEGIYPVTKLLWPDHVPPTLQVFKQKFCSTEYDNWTWDHMKVIGEKVEGAYFRSLPCVVRREWTYTGTVDEDTVYVELSPQQRKAYRELERDYSTWLQGQPFVIEFPSTLRVRLRQATLGMFHVDEEDGIQFADDCKSTKLDALMDILGDDFEDEPALIFTDSKRFAKVTVNRLGEGAELWSGDQSPAVRDAIKARFMAGDTKYVVMVVKAGGTGTDGLQFATRNMAWLSVDDSRIENEQAAARVTRRGQGDLVRIRHIVAVDTYDQGIMDAQLQAQLDINRSMRVD